MKSIRDDLEELTERIMDQRAVAGPDAIEEAMDVRDEVAHQLIELTRPNAYRRHLVEYLQDQKEKFETGERMEDGERKPLCDCSNPYCALKQGKLPPQVSLHDDLDEGITEYTASHSGRPIVLQEAREDYTDTAAEVRQTLERSLAILRRNERTGEPEEA